MECSEIQDRHQQWNILIFRFNSNKQHLTCIGTVIETRYKDSENDSEKPFWVMLRKVETADVSSVNTFPSLSGVQSYLEEHGIKLHEMNWYKVLDMKDETTIALPAEIPAEKILEHMFKGVEWIPGGINKSAIQVENPFTSSLSFKQKDIFFFEIDSKKNNLATVRAAIIETAISGIAGHQKPGKSFLLVIYEDVLSVDCFNSLSEVTDKLKEKGFNLDNYCFYKDSKIIPETLIALPKEINPEQVNELEYTGIDDWIPEGSNLGFTSTNNPFK